MNWPDDSEALRPSEVLCETAAMLVADMQREGWEGFRVALLPSGRALIEIQTRQPSSYGEMRQCLGTGPLMEYHHRGQHHWVIQTGVRVPPEVSPEDAPAWMDELVQGGWKDGSD